MFKYELFVSSKYSHGVAMPSFNDAKVGPGVVPR